MSSNKWVFVDKPKNNIRLSIENLITKCSKEKGSENAYDMIFPGLWLGNLIIATDTKFIFNNNIQSIINVSKETYIKLPNISYHDIPMQDIEVCENKDYLTDMLETVHILHDNIINKKNVLVHCKRGHHRSASIIVLYLIIYNKMSLYDAIYFIKTRRPTTMRRFTCMLNILIEISDEYSI